MKRIKTNIQEILNWICTIHPVRNMALGYLMHIIIGWILLSLPFSQRAGNQAVGLDHLFTSASAVSTTGLTTVSVSDTYNFFGQFVVMILIQIGGIGFMTASSFIILAQNKTFSKARLEVTNIVFTLPETFNIYKFIKSVILFTMLIESIGATLFYFVFLHAGMENAVWAAIFHSVSAFCTAGFGLLNNSFENYSGHFWINMIIAILSYLGAVGFIVFVDIWRKIRGKIEHVTLTTRIILWATFYISLIGTALFFVTEPTIQNLPVEKRLLASFFQTMAALTTVGFNTIPIGAVSRASLLLITTLMVIGAAPAGTGGGLKTTTFTALWGLVISTIKGKKDVSFWGRTIPQQRVQLAAASFCFYVTFLLVGVYFLSLTDSDMDFEKLLFEAASALGTVGLSTGITASLSIISKVILVGLMYAGRVGPLTFGLAMFVRHMSAEEISKYPDDLVV